MIVFDLRKAYEIHRKGFRMFPKMFGVQEHFIWAKGESPRGFWKVQNEVLRRPEARRQEPWRLALEYEKYSCLSGETDFEEAFTPSFDPRAQHILGLAPQRHQETPSRVPGTPSPLVYPPS